MPKIDPTTMLFVIAVLLALILWKISNIDARLKERFPTEREKDYEWSQKDPMGHCEAHKNDNQAIDRGNESPELGWPFSRRKKTKR